MAKVYGYVRVSSREQNVDRQVSAMKEYGIADSYIYIDKNSGKDFKRPYYKKMMKKLKAGDTLVIKSIDRLARDYNEILNQWQIITNKKKAFIVVLDFPLLNTRPSKDIIFTFISDVVLQVLSYVSQVEREMNHQRQSEGIATAKARGVKFGRPGKV